MCGIYCCICAAGVTPHINSRLRQMLRSRGPDFSSDTTKDCGGVSAHFLASVLHMRGPELQQQPVQDKLGNVLCWNGEIFGGLHVDLERSDSSILSCALSECDSDIAVFGVLTRIKGPWSLIYYKLSNNCLYFGRDVLGRRSLLWALSLVNGKHNVTVCSVGCKEVGIDFCEVPSDGIYKLDLGQFGESNLIKVCLYPWWPDEKLNIPEYDGFNIEVMTKSGVFLKPVIKRDFNASCDVSPPLYVEDNIQSMFHALDLKLSDPVFHSYCATFKKILLNAVAKRLVGNHPIAVLFSGGIDSLVLAALADKCLPNATQIDLINVAFRRDVSHTFNAPDRLSGLAGLTELQQLNADRFWNFVSVDVNVFELREARARCISDLVYPLNTVLDDSIGSALWFAASGRGHCNVGSATPEKCHGSCPQSMKAAIGTSDSCDATYPIKTPCIHSKSFTFCFCDGPTATGTYHDENLDSSCPSFAETITANSENNGKMLLHDDPGGVLERESHGKCAIDVGDAETLKKYVSPAKIVLVGMGADEQLGGYSRHQTAFAASGWTGLHREMIKDVQRLSVRNLGRDDRIISDHGRESRLPYLDEDVVDFLQGVPLPLLTDPRLPRSLGPKILLRGVAKLLGLGNACVLAKRAIQFGSRIAKCENRKERGNDTCGRL